MPKPTILITGASRGLGAATALIAAQLGANVAIFARSAEQLETVAQTILSNDGDAQVVVGDISRPADCQNFVEQSLARFGRIDALINNAGLLWPVAPIANADAAAWERNLAVNLLGPVYLTQAALPYLRQSRGRLVHVSSGAAVRPIPGAGAYSAAKAALNHFSQALAMEEADIISMTFRPGVIDTEMQATIRREGSDGMPAKTYDYFQSLHQNGELLPPEKPGLALALLAHYAPSEWSGQFINWDEERVSSLAPEGL